MSDINKALNIPVPNSGRAKFLDFGNSPTDYNYMALLICILNPDYTTTEALITMGVISSREGFEREDILG